MKGRRAIEILLGCKHHVKEGSEIDRAYDAAIDALEVMEECVYKGKTIDKWIELISAVSNADVIKRQAVMDTVSRIGNDPDAEWKNLFVALSGLPPALEDLQIRKTSPKLEGIETEAADYLLRLSDNGVIDKNVSQNVLKYFTKLLQKSFDLGRAAYDPDWALASENLPDTDDDVLICFEDETMCVGYYYLDDTIYPPEFADYNKTGWCDRDGNDLPCEPAAWTTLPPSFKKRQKEEIADEQ